MKLLKILFAFVLLVLVIGCVQTTKVISDMPDKKIEEMIRNNIPDDMVKGFYLIGEKKLLKYIPEIFKEIDDPRISHHLKFKGISIYQSKIIALYKMSGLEPPRKITYRPDTLIINFYSKWAREKGYLKSSP